MWAKTCWQECKSLDTFLGIWGRGGAEVWASGLQTTLFKSLPV
jgi:hypothetical protein